MNETILLIEDNESIIMGLEYLLTEEQYTFLAAKTKKEAQDLLASRQVDLVLLDVSLPDLICAGKLRNMTLHRSFF